MGRLSAAALILIVVDIDLLRVRVVVRVVYGAPAQHKTVDHEIDIVIVPESVLKDFDIVVRQYQQSRAGRNIPDYGPFGGKVRRIVFIDSVLEYPCTLAALNLQIRQIEYQNTAGIVCGHIVIDIGKC